MTKPINKFNKSQARDGWKWGGEVRVDAEDVVYLSLYSQSPSGALQEISIRMFASDAEDLRNDLGEAVGLPTWFDLTEVE